MTAHAILPLAFLALISATAAEPPERAFTFWDWTTPCRDLDLFTEWVSDVAAMGFNCAEVSIPWRQVEPEPGVYDWTFVDQRMDICERAGLTVRWRVNAYHSGALPAWYAGEVWKDATGKTVFGGIPSINDALFWHHFAPMCTALARTLHQKDTFFSPFFGVHAELKWADWWSYDDATLARWKSSITAQPRPTWLTAVAGEAVLPDRPAVPGPTAGTPDLDPASRGWIAFREECWRGAVAQFAHALRQGDPEARISCPLGESFRSGSAQMANLDYWGLTRGAQQVVHSYDFFWHANEAPWWAAASVAAFRGITGHPVVVELDGPNIMDTHGYTPASLMALCGQVWKSGAGLNVCNWSYTDTRPAQQPLLVALAKHFSRPAPARTFEKKDTVLLFVSKWANYAYREPTEWLHRAQFGVYRILDEAGIPCRFICEDNLDEDLRGYRALYVAFSPKEVLPTGCWDRLTALRIPQVIDTPSVPKKATGTDPIYANGPMGRMCVKHKGAPVMPQAVELKGGHILLETETEAVAVARDERVMLGFSPGLLYLDGPDPETAHGAVLWALETAEAGNPPAPH